MGLIFVSSVANLCDRYLKTVWLGFTSDQKSILDSMPDVQLQKLIPSKDERRQLPTIAEVMLVKKVKITLVSSSFIYRK